ncbi:MAG: hypothetical protein WC856_02465 [Methylococcaceae bacterium]|jgi:hypothetical protein
MTFLYILIAGLLGVLGHWWTRYAQGRTEESFFKYLSDYKANTIASLFSILTSSSVVFASAPVDIGGRDLFLLLIGVYGTGYMLDSKLNKGTAPTIVPEAVLINRKIEKTVEDIKAVDNNKTLDDIMKDDKSL